METENQSPFNRKTFHLPDWPEQEARDADMRAAIVRGLERLREGRAVGAGEVGWSAGTATQRAGEHKNAGQPAFAFSALVSSALARPTLAACDLRADATQP
ncbi:uncharacterized protein BXZ73DRAFT_107849 [Epithele typhae]|uniref:uncharacterized protein n=1 Tax=Epithele typhae TaxID=378194 RepID=UPI0020075927|nr:uncharacterized protein BXZ73DRAFT_107849 [Epithele typhae]KAH9911731.1 hypothetical protein BXZ73DRAFT_107849 [Epithele typhae]